MTKTIASELESTVSNAEIVSEENLAPNWQEGITTNNHPSCLVSPYTPEALSQVMEIAHSHRWRVMPCGSGSKLTWGGLPSDIDLIISTQYLNRIIDHAVGDLTVTLEAGVKLADLQHTLNQAGQFLPLDPAYPESATLGGIVATTDSGSWRQRYGGVRDVIIGISFIRADGQIAEAGGRVVKNVAGYDLMKLFTGSYGTLGIISQLTMRVYPLGEAAGTFVLTGDNEVIAQASQTLLASTLTPTAADLLSASVVINQGIGQGMGLMVRFQSIAASVEQQSAHLEAIAQKLGLQASFYHDTEEQNLWQNLRQLVREPTSASAITCKMGLKPNAAVNFLAHLGEITSQDGWGIVHARSGLGQLHLDGEDSLNRVSKLRSRCQENSGFLTVLEAPTTLKQQLDPWGYTGNALDLMRRLKQRFDSENLLSPGSFVGGI